MRSLEIVTETGAGYLLCEELVTMERPPAVLGQAINVGAQGSDWNAPYCTFCACNQKQRAERKPYYAWNDTLFRVIQHACGKK